VAWAVAGPTTGAFAVAHALVRVLDHGRGSWPWFGS
jgi:hypothetical protein